MLQSRKQFTFFRNWGLPSALIPSEYFPLRLGYLRGKDWNGNDRVRIFVSNEKDDTFASHNEYHKKQALGLRQVYRLNQMPSGFNAMMATADGMMERAVLSMLSQDDNLAHGLVRNMDVGEGWVGENQKPVDPAAIDLKECPFYLGLLERADVRAEMAYQNGTGRSFRMAGTGAWNTLRELLGRFLEQRDGRYDLDKQRIIFPPQITIGKWGRGEESGMCWTRLANNDASTILPIVVPSESDSESFCPFAGLISDIIRDSEFGKQCDVSHAVGYDGHGDISAFSHWLESYFSDSGLPDVRFRHNALPEEGTSGGTSLDLLFGLTMMTPYGREEFSDELYRSGLMDHLMAPYYPYPSAWTHRFSGFDWLALNVFLERACRYGVQGWTDEYSSPEGGLKHRVIFPNHYVLRTVTLTIEHDESEGKLVARLDNDKAAWSDEPTLKPYGEFSYSEGPVEEGGDIGVQRSYDLSRICDVINFFGLDDFLIRVMPDVIDTNEVPEYSFNGAVYLWTGGFVRPDPPVTCFHCDAEKLLKTFRDYVDETGDTSVIEAGGDGSSLRFEKNFTAAYCDHTSRYLTADGAGLDTFPCKFAKLNGYVPSSQTMYSIAHCRMWDSSEVVGTADEDIVFIDKANWGEGYYDRQDESKAMKHLSGQQVSRCYKSINIAAAQRQIGNDLKSKDEVLDWINSFDFGDGTEAFFQQLLDDGISTVNFTIDPRRTWVDFYIRFGQTDDGRIAESLYQTCIGNTQVYGQGSESWPPSTYWDNTRKEDTSEKIVMETGSFWFGCYPNRTEQKRDYTLQITTPRWLSAFNWLWKGARNW